jgi:hypothetical protein
MIHKSVVRIKKTILDFGCTQYLEVWVGGAFLETLARLVKREFWNWVLAP